MRFHAYKWNKPDKEYTMLLVSEDDIKNKANKERGAGWNILVIPSKYKNIDDNQYVNNLRMITIARTGEIIYI